jgi:hypothetical protein
MSLKIVDINRDNQMLGVDDVIAVNNTGAALIQGDVVLVDSLADGVTNSLIAPSSTILIANRAKAVVLNKLGIAIGATGKARIRGPVTFCKLLSVSLAAGDPLCCKTTASTGGTGLEAVVVQALGTSGVWAVKTVAINLAATAGSGNPFVQAVNFDGSDINGIFHKD